MATHKQITANRRNAQRSTGPRTLEGKSASSRNSLATGIYADAETALPHEDPEALAALAAEYHAHYQPHSPAERCLLDCLVSDEWLLRRFRRIEGELLTDRSTRISGDARLLGDAYGMVNTTLERLQRRINATRKAYLKTLEALAALQAAAEENTRTQSPSLAPSPDPATGPVAPAVQPPAPIGFVPSLAPDAANRTTAGTWRPVPDPAAAVGPHRRSGSSTQGGVASISRPSSGSTSSIRHFISQAISR